MKKKIVSLISSMAIVTAMVLVTGTTVQAGTYTYTDRGALTGGNAAQDNATNATTSFKVQGQVSGGGDVVYSVKVDWGAMKFEYDYGSVWDPATHKYIPGKSGKQGGGWDSSKVDGINNKITVTNNSNYPINVNFSYTNSATFNQNPSPTNVNGMFNAVNTDLKREVEANATNTQSLLGADMALNTCTADLTAGTDKYYYQNTDDGIYQGNMYFSLIGVPDRGINLTTMQDVGTIQLVISPATSTSLKQKA